MALFFTITLIREYIIQHQNMKDPLQQSYRNITLGSEAQAFPSLSLAEISRLFKMDYSAVSQTAKRFEQEIKVNHIVGEIKQKMMAALRKNSI